MKVPLLLCAYSIIQYWDTSKCSKTVPISKSKVEFIPPRFSISLESRARLFSYAYALHAALGRHIVKNAEQTLNIEKSPDTIFISNNDEVGEIQQYVEENSWPLNEVHNRSVEQVINMESVQTIRFVASQHEPANEASNLKKELCREEKRIDIETCENDKQKIICCYDMQAVLQTPAGNDSIFFTWTLINLTVQ
ncbi:unnamed protein product [Parnassius apollo]|uniref:(apollo) hypothetical protein n=1 Tax=Parnassius apollo TaxID=110799 RepID=A0A8S3XBX4_PARAO|nr:unnamed protein product [Parnassius apollo]